MDIKTQKKDKDIYSLKLQTTLNAPLGISLAVQLSVCFCPAHVNTVCIRREQKNFGKPFCTNAGVNIKQGLPYYVYLFVAIIMCFLGYKKFSLKVKQVVNYIQDIDFYNKLKK